MTKSQILEVLKLLCQIEPILQTSDNVPDYVAEATDLMIDRLTKILLEMK